MLIFLAFNLASRLNGNYYTFQVGVKYNFAIGTKNFAMVTNNFANFKGAIAMYLNFKKLLMVSYQLLCFPS